MKIALTGNPNSGKTTMYNALTGSSEKVGNWAGVTVDKKERSVKRRFCKGRGRIIAVDLPGAYSMSPFTSEESITRDYIRDEKPDVIINIVDATNLGRSLFFTTQILELGIPTVVALNKTDINQRHNVSIDTAILSSLLGCPVIETISTSAKGLEAVLDKAIAVRGKAQKVPFVAGEIDLADKDAVKEADMRRFRFVNEIVDKAERHTEISHARPIQDKIDGIITNRWFGIPLFAFVMFLVFYISQSSLGTWIADYLVSYLEQFQEWVGSFFEGASPLLRALLIDGVLGGVIAVVGFLPLVMIMYFLIALLEDCGYMARVSVILDPIFKKVGLSGKSVIPFVIATGCAIPGVMACRTIRDDRERRATAMLAPFMPCGAKLPVIALFAGAFFAEAAWVGPLMYFAGIVIIFFGALLVNKITGREGKNSYFIIELPEYKFPDLTGAVKSMFARGWSYVVKAATIILLCNTAVHIMQTFDWSFAVVETADNSILESIAQIFAYILIPVVGYHSWQLAAAAVTGFIAKENVVGTLATCYVLTDVVAELPGATPGLTSAAALAYLMFNLFTPPCFAAIGAMNAEMKDAKWLWGGIALQLGVGFSVAFAVYQLGTLFATGSFGNGFLPGAVAVAVMIAVISLLIINNGKTSANSR